MNQKLKHSIIFLFTLSLLLATLFVPRRFDTTEQMKNVKLGYPIAFVAQDFSAMKGFLYFPNWEKFEPKNSDYPYKILFINFISSLIIVFSSLEIFIYFLETIDFKIRSRWDNKREKNN